MPVITTQNTVFPWHSRGTRFVKGYLFDSSGQFLSGDQLLNYFVDGTNVTSFCRALREANGCFAVAVETDDQLMAAGGLYSELYRAQFKGYVPDSVR